MADDLTTTTTVSTIPDGTKIVTDEEGAGRGHMQVVKLAYSADGDATHISADSSGLLVNLGANNDVTITGTVTVASHAVTNAGTFVVQVDGAALTSLQAIETAVEGTLVVSGTVTANLSATDNAVLDQIELNTDPLLVVGGGTEATAIRVTIANNSTGVLSVDDNGGALTVDWAGTAPPIGAGVEATALRVTLATDSTGVVSIDDNGASLTVDSANLVTLAGAVSGSEMQVDVVAALPAGDNNIGNVDIVSGTITTVSTVTAVTTVSTVSALGTGTTGPQKAEDVASAAGDMGINVLGIRDDTLNARSDTEGDYEHFHMNANGALWVIGVDDATQTASLSVLDDWDNGASDGASVSGDVAHDTADAGEPVKIGMKAVALKVNPTEVAANDRTNWYADVSGIPFVLPGHMNTLSQGFQVTDADGAQTDAAIITAAANVAVVVTKVSVMADNANTVDVSVRIGFGTANTPAADAAQVLLFHPGLAPGSGVVEGSGSGIIGIGASGEDVRITCEDPVTGSINVIVTYFTTDI